jgi:hypothetical protein
MALPRLAMAHGFGQRYDLPVPLWLWVTAAAATVACSFLVIGLFVRSTPGEAHGYPRVNQSVCSREHTDCFTQRYLMWKRSRDAADSAYD